MNKFNSKSAAAVIALLAIPFLTPDDVNAQELVFGVLAGSSVTNTGSTVINGSVGVSPGTAITGFPPGSVTPPGAIHSNDGVAVQAQSDLTAAYNSLAGRPTTINLTGQGLGGLVLSPGVYAFDASAQLTGALTLNGQGNPNALFIFNIGSTLTTASGASVSLINGAQGRNVFYRVGSSATLGSFTLFSGNILALTSITANTGTVIDCGAVLARNGAVTLDTNTISVCQSLVGGTTNPDGTTNPTVGTIVAPALTTVLVAPITTVLPASAPGNGRGVAGALDAYVAAGGTLPLQFQGLVSFLSPSDLAAALGRLSGEAATGVAPTGIQAMNSFVSSLVNHLDDDASTTPPADAPGSTTPEKPVSAYASLDEALSLEAETSGIPRQWSIWGGGYGGQYNTQGRVFDGTHDRSGQAFGVVTGADYRADPETRVGFALAGGATNFRLSDNLGGGQSDTFQAAILGRRYFGDAYVSTVLAYGWNGVSTDRNLGGERLTASFSAQNIAGREEAGYRFALPDVLGLPGSGWVAPYAAAQAQAFFTPAYAELATPGASVFALNYAGRTTTAIRTELGARTSRTVTVDEGVSLELRARVAWAHDYWSRLSNVATFQSLPGASFVVNGALPAANSVLVSGGAELKFSSGFSLASWFESELSQRSQSYTGRAGLRYTW